MSSYTNVFGGNTINPTMLSYVAYTTAVDLSLVWSFEALDGSDVMAAKLDVTTSVASLSITFPKASLVSVGQDVLIRNVGANTFSILDFSGATLGTVASGEAWYFYLTDNSTDAGTWESVQFGTGTSSASAASLAGYGLAAVLTRLNQNLPTTALLGNYTFSVSDCASVVRSGTGVATWTFPAATTLGGGWFVYIINAGTGTLTLTPSGSDTIDGDATKALQPDESCIVFCDGSNFNTLGYGRAITSTITAQSISIAGGAGTTTLSTVQKSAQVQNFTGAITGNRVVEYGAGAGYWFVYNNTTGAYSVTFRTTTSPLDAGYVVPSGSFAIIRSDGPNMTVAFTATSGTVTNVATGAGLTGGPITTTGTIALAATAVTPGTYGDNATETVGFTVDAYGRITGASEGAIAIPLTQVTAFSSATLLGRLTDETGTGLAVFSTSPTLTTPVLGVAAVTSINGNTVPVAVDTVVLLAATQTLTNKTLTSPTINTPTINTGAMGAASTATTQSAGDNTTKLATTAYVDTTRVSASRVTNSLGADVTCNNTALYFDGPSVAQGSTGTWFASGTVTVGAPQGHSVYFKLWDGTTVISSAWVTLNAANHATAVALSGYISSPAGNIRISVRDASGTTVIYWNVSGNEKDSTVSVFRIA